MLEGIVTPTVHSSNCGSVKPVRSLPKTTATFPPLEFWEPVICSAVIANSSGSNNFPLRFLPLRRVVPAAIVQSAVASVIESKNSALS